MTKEDSVPLVVVGAGPAGLALAHGLSSLGHAVVALERQAVEVFESRLQDTSRAYNLYLSKRTMDLFHKIGFASQSLQTKSFACHGIKTNGKLTAPLKTPILGMARGDLIAALLQQCKKSSLIEFVFDWEVARVVQFSCGTKEARLDELHSSLTALESIARSGDGLCRRERSSCVLQNDRPRPCIDVLVLRAFPRVLASTMSICTSYARRISL
jgi:2-polyprenyl-6-methoxyphenol hydroxylase-like FAD-dependent oxidoreductase